MAEIKKNGARKPLAGPATPFPGLSAFGDGLTFTMQIGHHKVSLTHVERDMVIEKWATLEKQFETGS